MKYKIFFMLIILLIGSIPLIKADSTQWYNTSFLYRNVYEINSDLVDEELTGFPVLVYLNSSYVNWDRINNDLSDIYFVSSENVLLSHEIDNYVLNDEAWLWVKIPLVSNVINTKFFMYYGSVTAESTENSEDVWSNGFVGVWHMNDNSTSTILDSTSNDNDGIKKDANEPIETDGKIGYAQDLDGIDDQIALSSDVSITNQFTVSCWFKADSDSLVDIHSLMGATTSIYWIQFHLISAKLVGTVYTISPTYTITGLTTLEQDVWYYGCLTYDGASFSLYLDGGKDCSDVNGSESLYPSSATPNIGRERNDNSRCFAGLIDEFRFSNIARSSAWVKTNYYSQILQLTGLVEIESFNDENLGFALIAVLIAFFSFVMVITIKSKEKK